MAKGFKHGAGGVGLNFKVVGNPQPSNPKENTIWVNTNDAITSWVISTTKPGTPQVGMVWIASGLNSSAEFNALKKNGIRVYPQYVMQYISGAWVDKPAKIHQGGKWVDWCLYLYKAGNQFADLTGGFVYRSIPWNSSATVAKPSITDSGNALTIKNTTNNATSMVTTSKKINLTNYSKLYFDGILTGGAYIYWGIWSSLGATIKDNLISYYSKDNVDSIKSIDISGLSGSYYIGFATHDETSVVTMRRMWLER